MSVPKFSIIVPVYNAGKYIGMALDSVLAQTYPDWECICVDDGSKDSSGTILDQYATKDSRIKVIHQKNGGEAAARNAALDVARGEWLTCLDADDLYASDRLLRMQQLIEAESPDLVRFGMMMFPGDSVPQGDLPWTDSYKVYEGDAAKVWGWKVLLPYGMACSWAARKDLVKDIRFRVGMRVKTDSIFCARMCNRLSKVVASAYPSYFYRQISNSAINAKRVVEDVLRLMDAIEDVCMRERPTPQVVDIMRRRLRIHCDSEIADWVYGGVDITRKNVLSIYRRYSKMIDDKVLSKTCNKEPLWRVGFSLFQRTGFLMLLRMVAFAYKSVRMCKRII